MKHTTETLFHSEWSSDGTVGRRYDYATNIKLWYAFEGLSYILNVFENHQAAHYYQSIADGIKISIKKTMLVNGPFGIQISGGTNLDEHYESFYITDDRPYYDGEDTSTMLAPIYGINGWDDKSWINYQRFGRSLFCPNYEAENDGRTWFATAPLALDATALLASVGGSVTRAEMLDTVQTLCKFIDKVTGSIYWWPSGSYENRMLTRCSQGAGAWVWQYWKQWLGIEIDVLSSTLTISPRGLLSGYSLKNMMEAGFPFEIEYNEDEQRIRVVNRSDKSWHIQAGFRSIGSAAESEITWISKSIQAGETTEILNEKPTYSADQFCLFDIHAKEFAVYANEGVLFLRKGDAWYYDIGNTDNPPIDLRFVVGNAGNEDWLSADVTLTLSEGCSATSRKAGHRVVDDYSQHTYHSIGNHLSGIKAGDRSVAAFSLYLPILHKPFRQKDDRNSLHLEGQTGQDVFVQTSEIDSSEIQPVHVMLSVVSTSGVILKRELTFNVGYIPVS